MTASDLWVLLGLQGHEESSVSSGFSTRRVSTAADPISDSVEVQRFLQ